MIDEIVVASHNQGKVDEFADLLKDYAGKFYSAVELDLPEPEETGTTFAENAILKARSAAEHSGKVSLADDSGLCVNALDGAPGIYSARWAGPERDFSMAMDKLNLAVAESENKSAYFICVLAMATPGKDDVDIFEGRIEGQLIWPPRGEKGFGYDPMFVPEGYNKTFAELNMDEKRAISHRSRAFDAFTQFLNNDQKRYG